MRITVLGGRGAYPTAGWPCSGYLVESAGFRLLIDPGYATLPRLCEVIDPVRLDAVIVSHGHPDHCADLNPLLRSRALRDDPAPPLPVCSPPRALDAVLALDRPGMLDAAIDGQDFEPGDRLTIGPFRIDTFGLPHSVPNAGLRIRDDRGVLAYTGDTGPCDDLADLARDADVFIAEASYADTVPDDSVGTLSSAGDMGAVANRAGVERLVLAHLMPGTADEPALDRAAEQFRGNICVAHPGVVVDL